MLVVRNDDRPGVIGVVGTMLGEAQLNVSDMAVGRDPGGNSATMVITTRSQVPTDLIANVASAEGILSVDAIECC
ncbi:MAG: ACT domain-containing protein [Acidimicrobiales bacterium]